MIINHHKVIQISGGLIGPDIIWVIEVVSNLIQDDTYCILVKDGEFKSNGCYIVVSFNDLE